MILTAFFLPILKEKIECKYVENEAEQNSGNV